MTTYTLDSGLDILRALKPEVVKYQTGLTASKNAREAAKDVRDAVTEVAGKVRRGIAQAMARFFLASAGPVTSRSAVQEMYGKLPRPADLSEVLAVLHGTSKGKKVTKAHPDAVTIARQWAEADFTVTVETALKAVRGGPDLGATLTAAMVRALKAGLSVKDARRCLRDAEKAAEASKAPEAEAPKIQKVA